MSDILSTSDSIDSEDSYKPPGVLNNSNISSDNTIDENNSMSITSKL